MTELKLTPKQERFCQVYIETGNASEAYRQSYDISNMKDVSVNRAAKQLMDNIKIATRIREIASHHMERHEVTVDRVVEEYSKMAFANMLDYVTVTSEGLAHVDFSALTREQAAAIQEIKIDRLRMPNAEEGAAPEIEKVTFKLADKRASLDSLSKYLGMFVEKKQISGPDGGPLQFEDLSKLDLARRIASLLTAADKQE